MKRFIIFPLFAFFAISLSCSKEEIPAGEEVPASEEGALYSVYATVYAEGATTKLSYSESSTTISAAWTDGETFYAIQKTGSESAIIQFTLKEFLNSSKTSASFVATTSLQVTDETQWTAVIGEAVVKDGNDLKCEYKNQDGNLNSSGLKSYYYAKAVATGKTPEFNFNSAPSLSCIAQLKLPAGVMMLEYTPCGYWNINASGCTFVLYNDNNQSDYTSTNISTMKFNSTSAYNSKFIAIPAIDYSRTRQVFNSGKQNGNLQTGLIVTIYSSQDLNWAAQSNGFVFNGDLSEQAGRSFVVDMVAKYPLQTRAKPGNAIRMTTSDISLNWASGKFKQAGTVDTYWSKINIGASGTDASTEVGNYYAFGENITKSNYNFVYYTLRHKTDGTNNREDVMTHLHAKFVDNSSNAEFYSIQGSRYDVARVKWGSAWRMPHAIESYALISGNTKTTTTESGNKVVKYTNASTGNTLTLAVGGYMNETTNSESDTCAEFWTADKITPYQGNDGWNVAYMFRVYYDGSGTDDVIRRSDFYGAPVRPVLAKSTIQ